MTATGADWLVKTEWSGPCLRAIHRLNVDAKQFSSDAHFELLITFDPPGIRGYAWQESDGYAFGEQFEVNHSSINDESEITEDGFIIASADSAFDALCDAPSKPWPPCPSHSNHSLAALPDAVGVATWTCPETSERIARVGQLQLK